MKYFLIIYDYGQVYETKKAPNALEAALDFVAYNGGLFLNEDELRNIGTKNLKRMVKVINHELYHPIQKIIEVKEVLYDDEEEEKENA